MLYVKAEDNGSMWMQALIWRNPFFDLRENPRDCDLDSNLLGRWKGQVTLEYRYASTRLGGFKKRDQYNFQ